MIFLRHHVASHDALKQVGKQFHSNRKLRWCIVWSGKKSQNRYFHLGNHLKITSVYCINQLSKWFSDETKRWNKLFIYHVSKIHSITECILYWLQHQRIKRTVNCFHHCKKSGNWGLNEIDCHCSHKGQCTSTNYFSSYLKKFWNKKRWKKKFYKKILGKILEKKI